MEGDDSRNTLDGTTLRWNGGNGGDLLKAFFVSAGTSRLDMFGDDANDLRPNQAILHCADIACTVLSRGTFVANIHDPDDPDTTTERLNLLSNQSITSLLIFLNKGNNTFHADDLVATTQVFGSDVLPNPFSNRYYIGQVSKSASLLAWIRFLHATSVANILSIHLSPLC